jgi:hypothetical protein
MTILGGYDGDREAGPSRILPTHKKKRAANLGLAACWFIDLVAQMRVAL